MKLFNIKIGNFEKMQIKLHKQLYKDATGMQIYYQGFKYVVIEDLMDSCGRILIELSGEFVSKSEVVPIKMPIKINNKIKRMFCRHKNIENQSWQPTCTIKVCKDCGYVGFGNKNKKCFF